MDWLSLLDLADDASISRGEAYAARGQVAITSTSETSVVAIARGTHDYAVDLRANRWSCTCPVGMRGSFCKHLVAVALVASGEVDAPPPPAPPTPQEPSLIRWLAGLDPEAAESLLLELAASHPAALDTLRRIANRSRGDVSAYAELVDSLRTRRALDYRAANEHGREAHAVVDELERALTAETAPGLLPLVETAIKHLVRVLLRSDDSSGIQSEAARRLLALHVRAARLARPDAKRLARWMVRTGVDDQDFLEIDVAAYADVLGPQGLAVYRRELEKRLAQDPVPLAVRDGLERLAVSTGDLAEILRVFAVGPEQPNRYVFLVRGLREAGLSDDALHQAREGLGLLAPGVARQMLTDETCGLLLERGETHEVLRLRREVHAHAADERSYAALRTAAEACSTWPEERLSALDVLLEKNVVAWLSTLLREGEVDLAWGASRGMKLGPTMSLELLRARGRTHPDEVIDGYVALVREALGSSHQQSYRQAVALLTETRRHHDATGRSAEYVALVRELVEQNRRRPTLVPMLERLLP